MAATLKVRTLICIWMASHSEQGILFYSISSNQRLWPEFKITLNDSRHTHDATTPNAWQTNIEVSSSFCRPHLRCRGSGSSLKADSVPFFTLGRSVFALVSQGANDFLPQSFWCYYVVFCCCVKTKALKVKYFTQNSRIIAVMKVHQ